MQNIYYCECLLELTERERAQQQRHARQLREAGVGDRIPGTWLAIAAALLALLRLG